MFVYIAHRLFAAHDRALAAELADRAAAKLGPERVFLPFCDTDEEELVAEVKGRRLFELDRERLRHIDAMLALLHGPSLDDGVCMEIGYAAALGVPIVVVTTDFQTYSFTETGPRFAFPDPLIQALTTEVVRLPRLGPLTDGAQTDTRYAAFRRRNVDQTDAVLDAAIDALAALPPRRNAAVTPVVPTVYIEPSAYYPGNGEDVAALCRAAGHDVWLPKRFDAVDPVTAARDDLHAACTAGHVLADVSGPETPPGAAALIGAAAARGTRVAGLLARPTFTHAHGREPNRRNLMIQYGAEPLLESADAIAEWLTT